MTDETTVRRLFACAGLMRTDPLEVTVGVAYAFDQAEAQSVYAAQLRERGRGDMLMSVWPLDISDLLPRDPAL